MRVLVITGVLLILTAACTQVSGLTSRNEAKSIGGFEMSDPSVVFRGGEVPGARYVSGSVIYDEELRDGRLVTRYWSPCGQVWPEGHVENQRWTPDEPADTFLLSIGGKALAGGWEWVKAETGPDSSTYRALDKPVVEGVITLRHRELPVEVRVRTRLDGSPFMIRWLEITNNSDKAAAITQVAPFAGMLWTHRIADYLPKAEDEPFEAAYCHRFWWGEEGDFWFERLKEGVTAVDGGRLGRSGWGRPAFWAKDRSTGQIAVCELAWGGNYEFKLDSRTKILGPPSGAGIMNRSGTLFFSMGLSGCDDALRVLTAGETIRTPDVHLAIFQADADEIVQATHDHVRNVVLPEPIPGRGVEIEANHRGYLMNNENEPGMIADIDVAKSVGVEMYVVDAGWFGSNQKKWGRGIGDWHAGWWLPNGLEPVANHARKLGLKFGLWVEIEGVGSESELLKNHPEWLYTRNGQPMADSKGLDVTKPEVAAWMESELDRLFKQYNLDMYRIDHNYTLAPSGNRQFEGFTEDLTWRYYDTLYGIFDRLRARFPEVVFQNCAGGGGRLDWGTMHRFHNTEISDNMRMPGGFRILYGVTVSLPPEILLRTFGTEIEGLSAEADIDTQLRMATLSRPIFRGIAPSLDGLSPYLRAKIEHHLKLFRDFIRPTMTGGLVYHHTPFTTATKPIPWCVIEYAAADHERSVAGVFKTAESPEESYLLKPRGLDAGKTYKVTLDNSGQTYTATGRELAQEGILIRLERTLSSELVMMEKA